VSPPNKQVGRRAETSFTRGGPVTVIHADGTREVRQAYTPEQIERLDRRARAKPRTWDEINSCKGGGQDGGVIP